MSKKYITGYVVGIIGGLALADIALADNTLLLITSVIVTSVIAIIVGLLLKE